MNTTIVALAFCMQAFAYDTPVTFGGTPATAAWSPEARVSDPIEAEFDSIGMHGTVQSSKAWLEVSRQTSSGDWSPWVRMQLETFPGGRFWAIGTFDAAGAGRVRLRGEGLESLKVYEMEAFVKRKALPARPAGWFDWLRPRPGASAPDVIGRDEWGAREAKRETPTKVYRLTLHHTVGNYVSDRSAGMQEMRVIQSYHMGKGWDDIAYHYLIDAGGNIYQGRPDDLEGGHTKDNEEGNVGISFMGDFNDASPTSAQAAAFKNLGAWVARKYGMSASQIWGHRDFRGNGKKDCPGSNAYYLVAELRSLIGGRASLSMGLVSLDLKPDFDGTR